jgi:hypothetical protein
MNETIDPFELIEPASPEALIPSFQLESWMVLCVILLIFGMFLIFIKRKKAIPEKDPHFIRNEAYKIATDTLNEIDATESRDAAIQSSLILRKYLSTAVGDPSLYETHEETLARHHAFDALPTKTRIVAAQGFTKLAALKYTNRASDTPASEVGQDSMELLKILHSGFQA